MAEGVIVNLAGKLIDNLLPQALEKVGTLKGVKAELEMLMDSIISLQAMLGDAERRYDRIPHIKIWLQKLKDTLYDAQDVLEELIIEAIRRELRGHNEMIKEVRTFFSSSNQIAFKLKMSSKVRAVRERIEAIMGGKQFNLGERRMDLREERESNREETYSFICEGEIIGRDADKQMLIEFLVDSNVPENISILPIVGIGGLGKTALAKSVYNNEIVSKHFHLKMWVCVPNKLDTEKIVKNIIACAKKEPAEVTKEQLQSELRAVIDGKRYFLVLDEMWNMDIEIWLALKRLLVGGARGSKILITTRLPMVAAITSTTPSHFLQGLSETASLDLLMQMAGQKIEEIQDLEMLDIGKKIVRKCSGIPLVIRTIGGLLSYMNTKCEWLNFQDHELPYISHREDSIMSVLKLSYDHLPSHLKDCFAFCSLFPQEYEIKKQTLVNLWMAEGFFEPSTRSQDLEDIVHGYFMDLLCSNIFQDFQMDSFTNKGTCKMPNLMHDLACAIAGTECGATWDGTKSINERTRHISYGSTSNLISFQVSHLKASLMRTFLSTPTYREMERREPISKADLCKLIQSFKRLRILDLHAAIVMKVPRSICKLKHLTYLDLSHNNALKRLPNSITRLQNLQTLNLQGCSALEELPRGMRKLVSLQNLDIDYCHSLSYVPCGIGQLSSLHRLTRFILPEGKALAKNCCGLRELNGLNVLRESLSIENLGHSRDALVESKAANLIGKHSLESLILKWGYLDTDDAVIGSTYEALLDGLRPHSNLQKLTIERYEGKSFPKWMMDNLVTSLPNLVEIRLLGCGRCKYLPKLGRLPHLESLEIQRLTELECIELDYSSTSTASFPSLLRLEIQYCKNLKAMPLTPRLEDLILREVNLELINQIIGLDKLKRLDISQMEFLKRLPDKCLQSLTSLERLCISECARLTFLSLDMQHLSNLVHLSFSNCKELDLSKDESDKILDLLGLKSLRSVDILGVPKLASLPQWLLKVDNLEHLSIKKCLNFKALPEQIEGLQSLQQLEIILCPLLTSLPEGMQRLTSLSHLKIAGCPNLKERCKKDTGEDWDKIAHVQHITHELEYYERHL